MSEALQNWSGHHTFGAARVHRPQSIGELQEIVRGSTKVKVIGARHSFNHLADTSGDLISLDDVAPRFHLDHDRRTLTVHASITYGELCAKLHHAGYAIPNMASLPHITLAGAISTATHGSGDENGNLAAAVSALQVVTANGDLVEFSRGRNASEFEGAVVGLGALGVLFTVTLDLLPTFNMHQAIYEDLPAEQLLANFDKITSSAYSVSLFWDWQPKVNQVWLKQRITESATSAIPPMLPRTFHDATLATVQRHPVTALSAAPCTDQLGVVGPWHERLPHFRVDHTPASGDELQTEYFIDRKDAVPAIHALMRHANAMAPILWITEIRTVAADNFSMSPSYQRPTVGIHFSWRKRWAEVQPMLAIIENALKPFAARPHWGKLFTMDAARVRSLYPRLEDFRELLRKYDPTGKFRNAFVEEYIFGE